MKEFLKLLFERKKENTMSTIDAQGLKTKGH